MKPSRCFFVDEFLIKTFVALIVLSCAIPCWAIPPPNDSCDNAQPITQNGSVSGTTHDATSEGGISLCIPVTGSPDVFYVSPSPVRGTLRLSTCPSPLDAVLSVFVTCPGGPNTEIACEHGGCPALCGALNGTCLSVEVAGGSPNWI